MKCSAEQLLSKYYQFSSQFSRQLHHHNHIYPRFSKQITFTLQTQITQSPLTQITRNLQTQISRNLHTQITRSSQSQITYCSLSTMVQIPENPNTPEEKGSLNLHFARSSYVDNNLSDKDRWVKYREGSLNLD